MPRRKNVKRVFKPTPLEELEPIAINKHKRRKTLKQIKLDRINFNNKVDQEIEVTPDVKALDVVQTASKIEEKLSLSRRVDSVVGHILQTRSGDEVALKGFINSDEALTSVMGIMEAYNMDGLDRVGDMFKGKMSERFTKDATDIFGNTTFKTVSGKEMTYGQPIMNSVEFKNPVGMIGDVVEPSNVSKLRPGAISGKSVGGYEFVTKMSGNPPTLVVALQGFGTDEQGALIKSTMLKDPVPYKYGNNPNAKVWEGAQEIYSNVRKQLFDVIDELGGTVPNMMVTGHSLGGAVASLAANDIELIGKVDNAFNIVNYAGPPMANQAYIDSIDTSRVIINRLHHRGDPVTGPIIGHKHITNSFWDVSEQLDDGVFNVNGHRWAEIVQKCDDGLNGKILYGANKKYIYSSRFSKAIQKISDSKLVKTISEQIAAVRLAVISKLSNHSIIGDILAGKNVEELLTKLSRDDTFFKEAIEEFLPKLNQDNGIKILNTMRKSGLTDLNPNGWSKTFIKEFEKDHGELYKTFLGELTEPEKREFFKWYNLVDDGGLIDKNAINSLDDIVVNLKEEKLYNSSLIRNLDDINLFLQEDVAKKMKSIRWIDDAVSNIMSNPLGVTHSGKGIGRTAMIPKRSTAYVKSLTGDIGYLEDLTKSNGRFVKTNRAFKFVGDSVDIVGDILKGGRKVISSSNKAIGKGVTSGVKTFSKIASSGVSAMKGSKIAKMGASMMGGKTNKAMQGLRALKKTTKVGLEVSKRVSKAAVSRTLSSLAERGVKISGKGAAGKMLGAVGVGVDIGFTVAEIKNEWEDLEKEKTYVDWNGERIFNVYDPDMYTYIVGMKIMFEKLRTSYPKDMSSDDFVNIYFGRISENKKGSVLIDGRPANEYNPMEDPLFDKERFLTKDNIDFQMGKAGMVAWNIGKFGLTTALTMTGMRGVAVAIGVGVVDDIVDSNKKQKRMEGSSRALYLLGRNNVENEVIKDYLEKKKIESTPEIVDLLKATMRVQSRNPWEEEMFSHEELDKFFSEGSTINILVDSFETLAGYGDSSEYQEYIGLVGKTLHNMRDFGTLRAFLGDKLFNRYMYEKYDIPNPDGDDGIISTTDKVKEVAGDVANFALGIWMPWTNFVKIGKTIDDLINDDVQPFGEIGKIEYETIKLWMKDDFKPISKKIDDQSREFLSDPISHLEKIVNKNAGELSEEMKDELEKTEKLIEARHELFTSLTKINPNIRVDSTKYLKPEDSKDIDSDEVDTLIENSQKALNNLRHDFFNSHGLPKDIVKKLRYVNTYEIYTKALSMKPYQLDEWFNKGGSEAFFKQRKKEILFDAGIKEPNLTEEDFKKSNEAITLQKKIDDALLQLRLANSDYSATFSIDGKNVTEQVYLAVYYKANYSDEFNSGKSKDKSLDVKIDNSGKLEITNDQGLDVSESIQMYDYISRKFPDYKITLDNENKTIENQPTMSVQSKNIDGKEFEVFNNSNSNNNDFYNFLYMKEEYGKMYDIHFDSNNELKITTLGEKKDITRKVYLYSTLKEDVEYDNYNLKLGKNGEMIAELYTGGVGKNGEKAISKTFTEKMFLEEIGYDSETETYGKNKVIETNFKGDVEIDTNMTNQNDINSKTINGELEESGSSADLIVNSTIEEEKQLYRENNSFEPSGISLPVSKHNGKFTIQDENGKILNFNGVPNPFINNAFGFWLGEIPNASQMPINTLDNFFLLFHCEIEEHKENAIVRLGARIQKAIQNKTISAKVNPEELRQSVIVLKSIKNDKRISGVHDRLSNNGLLAKIQNQLLDASEPPFEGVIPNWGKLSKDYEIPKNIDKPLQIAMDIAKTMNDKKLARKFSQVERDRNMYEYVARTYIESARRSMSKEKLPNGFERLVLEQSIESEIESEKLASHIIRILHTPIRYLLK